MEQRESSVGYSPAIETHNLHKTYGRVKAVDGVDLQIAGGEIYGLIGPDGAGKTTTIRLLCGALIPSIVAKSSAQDPGAATIRSTVIRIAGCDMLLQPEQARKHIGYLAQRFSLYEELTVLENIRFFAEQRGLPAAEWWPRCMEILKFVGLADYTDRRAGHLSGGMKQKLGLAAALVHEPRILLLDEPTTGVDPLTRQDFWQLIIRLIGSQRPDGGRTAVLVSTPYMDEAARCTRVGFMAAGRIIVEGIPGELCSRLQGRVVELVVRDKSAASLRSLRNLLRLEQEVQDVQMFGDRLHLRVQPGCAAAVIERLASKLPASGEQVERLRVISAQLEDVFMDLLEAPSDWRQ
jgi:ABC-2 type transport system ATP-binding protein